MTTQEPGDSDNPFAPSTVLHQAALLEQMDRSKTQLDEEEIERAVEEINATIKRVAQKKG